MGAQTLVGALALIDKNKAEFIPQDEKLASYARKIVKEDGHLRWDEPVETILNRVRALSSWPKAFTFVNGKRILLYRASIYPAQRLPRAVPGQVLSVSAPEGLLVMAKNGVLKMEELQMEGRNRVLAAQFLAGNFLKVGDILE